MKRLDVILDLETMGLDADSVIIGIGAVAIPDFKLPEYPKDFTVGEYHDCDYENPDFFHVAVDAYHEARIFNWCQRRLKEGLGSVIE